MGIVVRQSFKTVLLTYLGAALGFINTLWLFPLVLSPEQIGLSKVLINIAFVFSTFAVLGAGNIPYRFFPYFKDEQKHHHGFLFFLLLIGVVGFALFSVVFLIFNDRLSAIYEPNAPLLVHYFFLCLPFTGIVIFNTIIESYLVVQQRPVVPNFVREVFVRLLMCIGLLMLFFQWIEFRSYVFLIVGTYGLGLAILLFYTYRQHLLFLAPDFTIFRSGYIKDISVFAGFIFIGNASAAIFQNIDSLMLSAYAGLTSMGIYSIAFFVASIIEIPKRSLSQVLIPMVSEANRNNDAAALETLYKKSSINQLIIGGVLFLGIWCNVNNIFGLMPHSQVFLQGKWVVFYIGLAKVFDMMTGINAEIIGTSRYYKMDLVFYVILGVLGIAANVVLIPMFGVTGAAIAMAISVFLFNTMRFFYILIRFNIQPFSIGTLKILVLAAAVIAGNGMIPSLPSIIPDIAIRSVFIASIFLGSTYALNVSPDINQIVNKVIRAIFHKILAR